MSGFTIISKVKINVLQFFSAPFIGAELAGAAGARAPPLFTPRPEIYSIKCA